MDGSGQIFTGVMLADILADRYGLIVEMASVSYVICISSVVDSVDSYDILFKAIEEIDSGLEYRSIVDGSRAMDIISGRRSAVVPGKHGMRLQRWCLLSCRWEEYQVRLCMHIRRGFLCWLLER